MLRHLKRVVVQFKPGDPKSVSARELLQRLSGDRAKKSNPQCKVEFAIDEEAPMGKSFVELHFADDDVRKIYMADQKVQDVTRMIDQKGNEMEMKGVLKEVNYDPWKKGNQLESVAVLQPQVAVKAGVPCPPPTIPATTR